MIPLSVPNIARNERVYVDQCLESGWVSSAGPFVTRFEEEFANFVGAQHAVAVCNGTAALHVAMVALGLQPQDEVLTPTITFVATVNAVRYCAACPVFFDCDEFFNIDVAAVQRFVEQRCELRNGELFNRRSGRRVWGILPTHVFGNAADIPRLSELAGRYNLVMLEDAAEAVGTFVNGRHIGRSSRAACYSFNGNKIMTTGGGGMVTTDSSELAAHIKYLSTQAKDDPLRFIHDNVGYNYRLTNLQAALGVAQLECMPEFLSAKRRIHERYRTALAGSDLFSLAEVPSSDASNFWLNNLRLCGANAGRALDFVRHLGAHGIEARPIWWPNHLQRPFREFEAFEISQAAIEVERVVSIPSSTGLTESDQGRVIEAVLAFR